METHYSLFLWSVLGIIAITFKGTVALNYVEVFRDDFSGTTVNTAKWNRVNAASQVNNELQ